MEESDVPVVFLETGDWEGEKGVRYAFLSQPKEETENIRFAIKRSRPYGSERWVSRAVAQFGFENTIRNPSVLERVPDPLILSEAPGVTPSAGVGAYVNVTTNAGCSQHR
jgi:hypothetical protein